MPTLCTVPSPDPAVHQDPVPRAGSASTFPYAVKEGPDPDGDVQERGPHVPLLQVLQKLGQTGHGLQGHQVVGVVSVIHAVDHGRQQLGPMLMHLGGK